MASEGGWRSLGFRVKRSTTEEEGGEEELLEPLWSVPVDTLGPFQETKRALVSLQVPLKLQTKVADPPAAGVPGTWSSGFWVRSGGERDRLDPKLGDKGPSWTPQ